MPKVHVKKGEVVVVLAGKEKGKRGKIIAVAPKKNRAIVEGLQMIKRHTRKSQEHPQGAIVRTRRHHSPLELDEGGSI